MTVADIRSASVITTFTFDRCGRSSILYGNTQGINSTKLEDMITVVVPEIDLITD
jgi:hypothetical protein